MIINGKYANNFITELNQKIELKYKITNCIDRRKQSDEDKRLTQYYLQKEGFDLFSKELPAQA